MAGNVLLPPPKKRWTALHSKPRGMQEKCTTKRSATQSDRSSGSGSGSNNSNSNRQQQFPPSFRYEMSIAGQSGWAVRIIKVRQEHLATSHSKCELDLVPDLLHRPRLSRHACPPPLPLRKRERRGNLGGSLLDRALIPAPLQHCDRGPLKTVELALNHWTWD